MALQANTVATQSAPPRDPVPMNSTAPALSRDAQGKPTGSFGRILHDRMSPQKTEPVPRKEPAQSDEQPLAGTTKAVTTDKPATEQTSSGNTLPVAAATVESADAEDDGTEPALDTIDVIGVAADAMGVAVVSSSTAAVAEHATTTTISPASALAVTAAGSAPGRAIATDPASAITATTRSAIPGAQSSKTEQASGGSPTVAPTPGTATATPAATNNAVTTTAVATTVSTAQITAAASAVVVAGGKDAASLAKSAGVQQAIVKSTAAGQQTAVQTASGSGLSLQQALSQPAQGQSTPNLAATSQTTSSPGQAIPGQAGTSKAGILKTVVSPNSDAKNALQQLAAGLRAADQRFVSIPNTLSTRADPTGTVVVDGSTAVPVILSNGQPAALSPLAAPTTSTVLTMPVGVQPGDPRWAQAFTDRVAWLVQGNVQAANIRLSPPELGQLDIRISLQNDQASILIASPHQTVRHALESTLMQLRQQFDNMGFVTVQAQVTDQQPRQRDQSYFAAPDSAVSEATDGSLLQPLAAVPIRAPQGLLDLYI